MAADPAFLLRLNAERGRLLQQQQRQGRQWQVVVICASRELNFGDPTPVQEFVRERVVWSVLLPEHLLQRRDHDRGRWGCCWCRKISRPSAQRRYGLRPPAPAWEPISIF